MTKQRQSQEIKYDATVPALALFSARNAAKLLNTKIVALLGYKNICMLINKNTDLIEAGQEYEDKLKFLVDIECKKQALHTK